MVALCAVYSAHVLLRARSLCIFEPANHFRWRADPQLAGELAPGRLGLSDGEHDNCKDNKERDFKAKIRAESSDLDLAQLIIETGATSKPAISAPRAAEFAFCSHLKVETSGINYIMGAGTAIERRGWAARLESPALGARASHAVRARALAIQGASRAPIWIVITATFAPATSGERPTNVRRRASLLIIVAAPRLWWLFAGARRPDRGRASSSARLTVRRPRHAQLE